MLTTRSWTWGAGCWVRDRIDSGELVLPGGALQMGQFGQQALNASADRLS